MAVYALVHGAAMTGRCWERVVPLLEAGGHDVVAVDLPCEDPRATIGDYADAVVRALDGAGDEVVVVGHSLGGLTVPVVAARRPVREMVFVCAVLPEPGRSVFDGGLEFVATPVEEWQILQDDGSFTIRPDAIATILAQDIGDPDVLADIAGYARRQSLAPFVAPCPLESLPEVPRRYLLCGDDRVVDPAWSRSTVPEVLGTRPDEFPGGHMVASAQPRALADWLLG